MSLATLHESSTLIFHSYIMSQCALHIYPWSFGRYHSCNLSQLPGEYTTCFASSEWGTKLLLKPCFSGLWFLGIFQISWFFTNLPLPQNVLERREIAIKPLVSCLWGYGESVNPPKILHLNVHPGGSGALSSRPKGDPCPIPIFQDFFQVFEKNNLTYLKFFSPRLKNRIGGNHKWNI